MINEIIVFFVSASVGFSLISSIWFVWHMFKFHKQEQNGKTENLPDMQEGNNQQQG
jgi:hypothetical protein